MRRRCKRPSPRESGLRRLRRSRGQDVRLTVERCNQPVDALALQDRGKFGVAGRHLADRAALFTEELPWLKGRDLELVMGEALCNWIGWPLPGAAGE